MPEKKLLKIFATKWINRVLQDIWRISFYILQEWLCNFLCKAPQTVCTVHSAGSNQLQLVWLGKPQSEKRKESRTLKIPYFQMEKSPLFRFNLNIFNIGRNHSWHFPVLCCESQKICFFSVKIFGHSKCLYMRHAVIYLDCAIFWLQTLSLWWN